MKRLLVVMVILLCLLQYRLWFGQNNLPESIQLKKQIAQQKKTNVKLVERNQVLKEEIIDLRQGTEAIEERARNELGMIKKGETFYRVVSDSPQKEKAVK